MRARIKGCLLFLLFGLLGSCQSTTSTESAAKPSDCPVFRFVGRSQMVAPYVAIGIDADSNFTVAKVVDESSDVEVERISADETARLREEMASATEGKNMRIFIVADGNSQIRSYIASLDALKMLDLTDYWIVTEQRWN